MAQPDGISEAEDAAPEPDAVDGVEIPNAVDLRVQGGLRAARARALERERRALEETGAAPVGVWPGVSYETYQRWPALRQSYLREFARTAKHARHASLWPPMPTPAQSLGTAIHAAILEPDAFERDYAAAPKVDRRTNAGKAAWAAFLAMNGGRELLEPADYDAARRCRDSVWGEPWAHSLLAGRGASELSVVWDDPEFCLRCKARVDRYCGDFRGVGPVVVDLKSTRDASPERFAADAERFRYGLQAAFYLDGLAAASEPRDRQWAWIAVETHASYAAALYIADADVIEEGRRLYRSALGQHLECSRTSVWPGYSPEPRLLGRPRWARRIQEEVGL